MIKKLLLLTLTVMPFCAFSQISFTDASSTLDNSNLKSGVAIGVCDMNGDRLDDIVRLSGASSLQVEYQSATGNFSRLNYGNVGSVWGMAIADVDKNGFNDIIVGGSNNGLKLLKANSSGTSYSYSTLSGPNIFLQNANFADIDNNGTIDFFGCHDNGLSVIYSNDGIGNLTKTTSLISPVATVPSGSGSDSKDSGNYGSIWTDYDNDGDLDLYISKCRLSVNNPNDGRRINLLFRNDGSNNYTEVGVAAGLVPYAQSWAANFEDIDNDGDLDCVLVNHDQSSYIYENNGNGTFTNITSTTGISSDLSSMGSDGIQVIMEDFDNDTYIDFMITSRGGSDKLFKNNGNKTFSLVASPFPTSDRIQTAAVGDLNNDGFIDVIAAFGNGYNNPSSSKSDKLFLNVGNTNNWSEITLQGGPSNLNGIGARIEIYGAWGKQIREVRSGESYGIMNSMLTHFGLGSNSSITKIVVKWPSGLVDEVMNPSINQSLLIVEGATLGVNPFTNSKLTIYPNPAKDFVTIEGLENDRDVSYEVIDVTGKIIKTKTMLLSNKVDISTLNNGVYFLNIFTDTQRFVHKIVKE